MKVKIELYANYNQSKIVNKETKERQRFAAIKTVDTLFLEISDKVTLGKQLAQISYFANRSIGARYAAFVSADKKMPSLVYFKVTIGGQVYKSETMLVKANLQSLAKISFKKLTLLNHAQIINNVAEVHTRALKTSLVYLNDVKQIAIESENVQDEIEPENMQVSSIGELVAAN